MLGTTDPSNSDNLNDGGVVWVGVWTRDVFAIYDNNFFGPWLMIIIKNIILYFIQIRHTDDFPSTN